MENENQNPDIHVTPSQPTEPSPVQNQAPESGQPQPQTQPEHQATPAYQMSANSVNPPLFLNTSGRDQVSSSSTASAEPAMASAPAPAHHGMKKWILIAAVVLLVAGVASGLYFSGVLNPPAQPLNGAAEQTQSSTSEQSGAVTDNNADTQQTDLTQMAFTACPAGQVKDPSSNTCACDINSNYFAVPADLSPGSSTQQLNACTSCGALSNEILQLGQNGNPADALRLTELQSLAQQQNCSPCSSYDDGIAQASTAGAWDKYFNLVVQKSEDNTCGQHLATCDSLKWQLLTMTDLLNRISKNPTTDPTMIQSLKDTQRSLSEDLGNNAACYSMQDLCTQLQGIYNPTVPSSLPKRTKIFGMPLVGSTPVQGSTQMVTQQTQFSSMQLDSTAQSTQQVDYGSMTPDKFFDKQFYLLHCPVGGLQPFATQEFSQQLMPQTQATTTVPTGVPPTAPKRVKRVVTKPIA